MKKTLALLLAMVMILALCAACGGSKDEPAAAEAAAEAAPAADAAAEAAQVAADAAAPADDASGEPSEEPTGEPVAELYPADGYDKTLDGYKAYAIDALKQDEHAPAEIVDTTIAGIEAATDGNDEAFSMLTRQGLILTYDEFMG